MDLQEVRFGVRHLTKESYLAYYASEGQEHSYLGPIFDKISELPTRQEEIVFVAVQRWFMRWRPEALVATNKRIINLIRGLFTGFSFHDYPWIDVVDAKIREGFSSSGVVMMIKNGRELAVSGRHKKQAIRLFSIAREMEQYARAKRRIQGMEESRAKAGGVNFYEAQEPAIRGFHESDRVGAAAQKEAGSSPASRLAHLKELHDAGLITDAEFQDKRRQILTDF